MTETKLIDGKAAAAIICAEVAKKVIGLKQAYGTTPGLAVVLVGNDPASEVYVRNKGKQTREAGMNSFEFHLPKETTEDALLAKIHELNHDPKVHGILVQLPLPKHISEIAIIDAINPSKDVDGFHVVNAGKLATGLDAFVPCTPLGCMRLINEATGTPAGKHAVVVGRSNIVGKPMAQLLLREHCTVTIAHSKTKDLPALLKTADIVIAAIGKPKMIKGEWLKKGVVVIDVGINRVDAVHGKTKLVGDVDFDSCQGIASAITPVPGGVGPMTIACLLENTYKAASV
jgi:methylenetetrahydrofolate dehydrogenase (NADP+) / methenyltetrahydrofolate cyclohydrolase